MPKKNRKAKTVRSRDPKQTAQTAQGERKSEEKAEPQGQKASAGNEGECLSFSQRNGFTDHNRKPLGFALPQRATRELLASSTTVSLKFVRSLSDHRRAIEAFAAANLADLKELELCFERLSSTRAALIIARADLLGLNGTNV